jgi:uncharacterized protein DUF4386
MGSITTASPRFTGRMAGLFYLLYCATAGVAMFARRGLIVGGNAAATATNIMAHRSLYQFSFASDLVGVVCYVATVALLYELLKPVNTNVSTVAAFFGLTGCVVQGFAGVFQLAPLVLLGGASYLGVFSAEQLQAQAYFFLRLYTESYCIALVCFGFFDLMVGYLVFKSTFMPRILGLMMMLAGLAIMPFLVPAFGIRYFAWMLPFAVGEILVILWLIVKGVDVERWRAQARETGATLNAA